MGAAATTRARFTLGVTGVVVLLLCMAAAPARASKSEWSLFEDHTALVQSGVKKRISTLNEIKGLGADTLRIEFKWNEIAPKPQDKTKPKFDAADPAAYAGALDAFPGFGQYDDLVQRATAMGFRILITITGDAPRWATAGGKGSSFATANWGVSADEYGKFAAAVAKRYSGKFGGLPAVYYYSIWNEPNHKQFIKPQSSAPAIYRGLVDAGVPAIRANGPKAAKVFVGETAPVGRPGKVIGPRAFFQKWLCLNKRFKRIKTGGCAKFKKVDADGYAHHPYGPVDLVPKKADIINLLAIPRLASFLDAAARAGRLPGHLPIYDTEFGLQSNPPDPSVSTTPSRQAQLINEKEEYSYKFGRLKSYSQYLLFDDPARKGPRSQRYAGFQTGLRFANGKPKPALGAYRLPIVVHKRGRGVLVWGRVRPGTGSRYVQLQRNGKNDGKRLKTNSHGYFSVKRPKAGNYRFRAYDGPGSGGNLIGTSRTASPIP
jgi:Cellulase (glycosyl hydrolase family 5)